MCGLTKEGDGTYFEAWEKVNRIGDNWISKRPVKTSVQKRGTPSERKEDMRTKLQGRLAARKEAEARSGRVGQGDEAHRAEVPQAVQEEERRPDASRGLEDRLSV